MDMLWYLCVYLHDTDACTSYANRYADDVRLSKYRCADYLNAGTNEVEAAATIYEGIFPMIEKSAHYLLNFGLICYLMPRSTPLFIVLIPITLAIQGWRGGELTRLLQDRQVAERQYVASFADIIENTQMFRSLTHNDAIQEFSKDTSQFAGCHLKAVKYTIVTKERVEFIQGCLLASFFFISTIVVNGNIVTKGTAVGVIQAFVTSSKDILEISAILLKMKFNSEGLRMIARILNFPTDAHQFAEEAESKLDSLHAHMALRRPPSSEHTSGTVSVERDGGRGEGKTRKAAHGLAGTANGNGGVEVKVPREIVLRNVGYQSRVLMALSGVYVCVCDSSTPRIMLHVCVCV